MAHVQVDVVVDRGIEEVWSHLSDIAAHVAWMADAEAIRFTSDRRRGVGTTFDCDTRVGPLRLVDRMRVTEWREGREIGVHHTGVVTGTGRFTLDALGAARTRVVWEEDLRFPWWLGGTVGGAAARPVFVRLWRANLRRLRRIVESRPAPEP